MSGDGAPTARAAARISVWVSAASGYDTSCLVSNAIIGPPNLDISALAKRSWAMFQERPVEHLVAGLLVVTLSALSLGLLAGPLLVGHIRMVEGQERGEPIRIEDVFAGFRNFAPAFVTNLIVLVCVMLGLMVLVLPGLFIATAWGFALWFVALRRVSSGEALRASWELLKAQPSSVVLVLLLVGAVNAIAGSVLLATLLSAPLSSIFCTLAFQQLVRRQPEQLAQH